MKKSQLKKIIRESIKELMNEQYGPNPPCYTCLNGLIYTSTAFQNPSGGYLCGGASANNYPTFFTGTVDPNTSTLFPPGPFGGMLAYFSDINDPRITSIGCSPPQLDPSFAMNPNLSFMDAEPPTITPLAKMSPRSSKY